MAIPEAQLEIWAHQGASVTAAAAYESVRNVLKAPGSPVRGMDTDIYLQGSYRNGTNVRGDSDVDVIAQLNSTFGYDLSRLTLDQTNAFRTSFPNAAIYQWSDFRRDVLAALRARYGTVREGNRSLKIQSNGLEVDVIPAIEHRKYDWFYGPGYENHVPGIRFHTHDNGRMVINFPKLHYQRGVEKNSENCTNGWYKASVRMIKNAKTCAADRGYTNANIAPSYFIECLVFNVPDHNFGKTFQETYAGILNFLYSTPNDGFTCQNGQIPLFGKTPEQWSAASAMSLTNALIRLWNDW